MSNVHKILDKYADIVSKKLTDVISFEDSDYSLLTQAMNYSAGSGGKRIRPALLLEFYKLCGGKDDNALCFAAALEMIHTYSLIHDDLPCMDDDDMRRGKPSCHIAFGEDIAVLAGDALLTEAFSVAASTKAIPAARVISALKMLSASAGVDGMIGGQVMDIKNENGDITAEQLEKMCDLKTGALIRSAAVIGCILAGREDKIDAASGYANCVGLAFQIVDDLLDFEGDEVTLGKRIGSDEKNNKTTFVSLFGAELCRERIAQLTEKAKSYINEFEGDGEFLKDLADYLAVRKV